MSRVLYCTKCGEEHEWVTGKGLNECKLCGNRRFSTIKTMITPNEWASRVMRVDHLQDCNVWQNCEQCDAPDLSRDCTCKWLVLVMNDNDLRFLRSLRISPK